MTTKSQYPLQKTEMFLPRTPNTKFEFPGSLEGPSASSKAELAGHKAKGISKNVIERDSIFLEKRLNVVCNKQISDNLILPK